MRVLEGIHSRASIGKLKADGVDRSAIETLLEAAVQAPNHRLTEPWRFVVVQGPKRDELGAVMERLLLAQHPDASQADLEKERAKPLRAPVIVVVGSVAGSDAVETAENYAATAAAVQNMLLAAHEMGLAAQWRTGAAAYAPELREWLGFEPTTAVVALVYLGHPNMEPRPRRRAPASEKTTWRGG